MQALSKTVRSRSIFLAGGHRKYVMQFLLRKGSLHENEIWGGSGCKCGSLLVRRGVDVGARGAQGATQSVARCDYNGEPCPYQGGNTRRRGTVEMATQKFQTAWMRGNTRRRGTAEPGVTRASRLGVQHVCNAVAFNLFRSHPRPAPMPGAGGTQAYPELYPRLAPGLQPHCHTQAA